MAATKNASTSKNPKNLSPKNGQVVKGGKVQLQDFHF
jgi:hypothetical protein